MTKFFADENFLLYSKIIKKNLFQCLCNDRGTTLDKKRTILEIRGEKNAVPRDIMLDQARSAQGESRRQSRIGLALR